MEKRFNPRKEINSSVLVFHKKTGCIKALVKNFSMYGMLVDTEQSTLPKGSMVELAGPASWKLESRAGLPKALIIHSQDGKAGLMLTEDSGKITELSGITATISLKKRGIQ
jgi:hypothetical protein